MADMNTDSDPDAKMLPIKLDPDPQRFSQDRPCVCEKWTNLPSEIKSIVNVKSLKANYRKQAAGRPGQEARESTGRDWTSHSPKGPLLGPMGIITQAVLRIRIRDPVPF